MPPISSSSLPQASREPQLRRAALALIGAAAFFVSVLFPASLSAGQSASQEKQPSVRIYRSFDFDPIFDPVFSISVVAEHLRGCDTPVLEDGVEESRGLSVVINDQVVYRTGESNIQIDYGEEDEPVTSFVRHFGAGSFITNVPGSVLAEGRAEVLIECRNLAGEWVTSFVGSVDVPTIDIPLWLVGIGEQPPGQQRLFANYMGFDQPPDVAVELSGELVAVTPDPEFFNLWSGPLPDELAPGLHIVTARAGGLSVEQATIAYEGLAEIVDAELLESPPVEATDTDPDSNAQEGEAVGPTSEAASDTDAPANNQDLVEEETETEELAQQEEVEGDEEDDSEQEDVVAQPVSLAGPYAWVVEPPEFDWSPSGLLTSISLAFLIVVLIGWQADVVNKTIEANRDDIRTWPMVQFLMSSRRLFRAAGPVQWFRQLRYRQFAMLAFYATLIASFTALAAPRDEAKTWFDSVIWEAPGTALAILLVVGVYAWGVELFERELVPVGRASFRLIPWSIAPAVALTAVSWIGEFRPPYIYGLIGGFLASGALSDRRGEHRREGLAHVCGAGLLIVLALFFYALAGPIHPLENEASWLETVGNRFVIGSFVVAIQALVFGMLPLEFMDGAKIFKRRKLTWALVYFLGMVGFVHVLVLQRSQAAETADTSAASAVTSSVALFFAFMLGSLLFWGYFRLRSNRLAKSQESSDADVEANEKSVEVEPGDSDDQEATEDQVEIDLREDRKPVRATESADQAPVDQPPS